MRTSANAMEQKKKVVDWRDFSLDPFAWDGEFGTPAIAASLRRVLEHYEESEFIKYLVLPSPVALSGFFHCAEGDIQDALHELQRQGYEVELSGRTGPIMLWDPLVRQKRSHPELPNSWDLFYQAFFPPSVRGKEAR